ncbi:MAG: PIN domain-containing protein [Rhodothermales bacterium]|nr:PIN domain-containing protein [Rhodothermales bacterium]MBO6780247.1 PIN domain-containing protein [Rhodothermales bacterium]
MRILVDTNVWIRLVARDDPGQAEAAAKLIGESLQRGYQLVLSTVIAAELAWVLGNKFKLSWTAVADFFQGLSATSGVELENEGTVLAACHLASRENVDFADAYNALWAQEQGITTAFTFDTKHFRRLGFEAVQAPG